MKTTLAVMVLFIAACKPSKAEKAKKAEWFLRLQPCSQGVEVDTSGWRTIRAPGEELRLKLPPGFTPVESNFFHGGASWKRGESKFSMIYGYWGFGSFRRTTNICRTLSSGLPVVVFTLPSKGVSQAAWFVGSVGEQKSAPDILLSFHAPAGTDPNMFAAIIRTASR